MLEQIIPLIIGWLAGMLSPAVIENIKGKRETTSVLSAIKSEINEVGYRTMLASYSIKKHLGTVDRNFLKWVQDSVILYHGNEPTENISGYIAAQLSMTDEELEAYVLGQAATGLMALTVPKFALPFTDARVPSWHAIPPNVRLELLIIHAEFGLINDAVDQSRYYFGLTFTKLESNYETVSQNLRGAYEQYGKRCQLAAQRMQRLHSLI